MTTRGNSHGCRLSEADYNRISNQTIDRLCEYFERLGDENDISGFDCECANGVLTLRLGSKGTYVMNRQPPNKQIWLSSPVR
jgi:frataxin